MLQIMSGAKPLAEALTRTLVLTLTLVLMPTLALSLPHTTPAAVVNALGTADARTVSVWSGVRWFVQACCCWWWWSCCCCCPLPPSSPASSPAAHCCWSCWCPRWCCRHLLQSFAAATTAATPTAAFASRGHPAGAGALLLLLFLLVLLVLLLPAAAAPAPPPLAPAPAVPAAAAPAACDLLQLSRLVTLLTPVTSASLHSDDYYGHAQLWNPPGRLAGAFLLLLPLCAGPAAFSAAASPLKLVVLLPLLSP